MALAVQKCGSRSDADEENAKKLIEIVENKDADAKLIRDAYKKRFAPDSLPAIDEIASQLQDFSKTLVNHQTLDNLSLLRKALLQVKDKPDMTIIDFLINHGAKMFLGDLRLAAGLDDKACAQKILKAFFDANEKLLEDPILLASFDNPVVLDCAHTIDQNSFYELIKSRGNQFHPYRTEIVLDENGNFRPIDVGVNFNMKTHLCPTCRKKFESGFPSKFTSEICKLSEAQKKEDTPQKFIDFIDMAKDSRLEGVLAKEFIRQGLLKSVLHEGWVKKTA